MMMTHKGMRRKIRKWNRAYRGGFREDQPHLRKGIEFWCVGQNASHEFYVGLRDGQLYRYAAGGDDSEEGASYVEPEIYKISDFTGYFGHF